MLPVSRANGARHEQQEGIMPSVASLPARENTIDFTDEYVREVAALFQRLARGEAVTLDDDGAYGTESMARSRARVMADKLRAHYGIHARTHTVEAWDADGKRIKVDYTDREGKPVKNAEGFYPALSVNQSKAREQAAARRAREQAQA
jgi:hypothetical protein